MSDPLVRGSSPRMRGSHLLAITDCVWAGIIPAHAGLTSQIKQNANSLRDHPRACGAHTRTQIKRESTPGSSPRMRGSPKPWKTVPNVIGIIPAHAGLTGR